MDDSNPSSGPSLSRRGLIRGATSVVVAGALLEAAAGSLGAAAAPASGSAGQLTLFDTQGTPIRAIDVLSWSWGSTNPSSVDQGGGSTGGSNQPMLTITKEIDEASPILLQQEAGQITIASALLSFTSADGEPSSIQLQQIQSVSNELDMAVKSQGVPEYARHTCFFGALIIVVKIGNVTITITIT